MSFNGNIFRKTVFLAAAFALVLNLQYGCSKSDQGAPAEKAAAEASTSDLAKEHFEKGLQHTMKGEYDQAIKEYEETIKYNPESAEAYNNMGFAYMDKGDAAKAAELQSKAVELKPTLANGYYGLAMALEKKGDNEGAIKNWKEFVKLSEPHSKWWMKAQERIAELEKKGNKKKK